MMSAPRRSKRFPTKPSSTYSKIYQPIAVPSVGDNVLLSWKLNSRNVWWKANVLSSSVNFSPPIIGIGTISYEELGNYKKEECDFNFLQGSWRKVDTSNWFRHGKLLEVRGRDSHNQYCRCTIGVKWNHKQRKLWRIIIWRREQQPKHSWIFTCWHW